MNEQSNQQVPIPKVSEAAAKLFACISRFEFALKECGEYVCGPEDGKASPDWGKFSQLAQQQGAYEHLTKCKSTRILSDAPPRKQIRKGDAAVWSDPISVSNMQQFTEAIRQVRNNLFHGGKSGPDPRDDELCEAASHAIIYLMHIDHRVEAAFRGQY